MTRKHVLDRIEAGYALMIDSAPFGEFLFVGSEAEGGQSRVIRLESGEVCTATTAVGGMMHILRAPCGGGARTAGGSEEDAAPHAAGHYGVGTASAAGERPLYVAAMGMYAPFIGRGAAVYALQPGERWDSEWGVEKLFDIPFVHRLGFMEAGGRDYLFVATVSDDKESPEDWSRPGRLYVTDFRAGIERGRWDLQPVGGGIHRNHGMWAGVLDGRRELLVSGAEGLFAIRSDGAAGAGSPLGGSGSAGGATAGATEAQAAGAGPPTAGAPGAAETAACGTAGFHLEPIIEEEISEMVARDLDGDGVDEMVTIEPFHGHRLRVYKRDVGTGGAKGAGAAGGGASAAGGAAGAGASATGAAAAESTGGAHTGSDPGAVWRPIRESDELRFGHGLNVVRCGSRDLILVGNRREGKELLAFDPGDLSGEARRYVLDTGVGPTQIEPWAGAVSGAGGEPSGSAAESAPAGSASADARIISCNQGAGEVAVYELSEAEL